MSHDVHAGHGTGVPLPVTTGITFGVKLLIAGCVVLSIVQGSFVVAASNFGRVWPAADSAKIQLPPKNF